MPRSARHLKIVPNQTGHQDLPYRGHRSIGRVLLAQNLVTEGDLLKAQSIQRFEAAPIGEILIGLGKITTDQLYWALGQLHRLEIVDFKTRPPSTNWTDYTCAQTSLKLGYIVWRDVGNDLIIAVTDPNKMQELRHKHKKALKSVTFVLVKPSCLQSFVAINQCKTLEEEALVCCPKSMSCRTWSRWAKSNTFGMIVALSVLTAAFFAPLEMLIFALSIVLVAMFLLMGFRIACLIALRKRVNNVQPPNSPPKPHKRPKVSILVPVYKETVILERLIERLQSLAYPKELLEICFIFEENDHETKMALAAIEMPWFMKSIEVPYGNLQTKPRAMNYALDFCSGSIIGVYDAEDAPELNQIEQVVQKFATSDEKVACIQCVLDFYNARTNWMSRCFTLEYAVLFRLILPALDQMRMPIPLGGTSVFFRREILEKLGRWDAYNVTEDADLGYRLYRMGYRCSWINAVTYEEANYRIIPWIKQRSRWLKGFFLTALVHFRTPIRLQQKVGTFAILSMMCLMMIPWIVYPLTPIILPLWVLSLGLDLPLFSELPKWFSNTLVTVFITTQLMAYYLDFKATNTHQHKHLRPWIVITVFYWPLACIASYKALYEVFTRPAYWDKSEHGVNDKQFASEIQELTTSAELKKEHVVPAQ